MHETLFNTTWRERGRLTAKTLITKIDRFSAPPSSKSSSERFPRSPGRSRRSWRRTAQRPRCRSRTPCTRGRASPRRPAPPVERFAGWNQGRKERKILHDGLHEKGILDFLKVVKRAMQDRRYILSGLCAQRIEHCGSPKAVGTLTSARGVDDFQ